jgi:hypothetical protein
MCRFLLPLLFLAALALPLPAGEKVQAKSNTLTSKEVADGWILLFDGETTFGWKIDGEAKVEDGVLILGGTKATTAETTTALDWRGRFAVSMETRWEGSASPTFFFFGGMMGLTDASKKKFIRQYMSTDDYLSPNPSHKDIKPQVFKVPAGSKLLLRNVMYQPRGLKAIFNGKDLTGWKEVKNDRTKSKFTVSDKGELNIKDGPGDLQTEGQWDDFILQLDVFSNGKHLNSGVFFRCIPGQFWSGYEAQIRNQWEGDDRTKPVDYGTGGIYNRQPARKVVSSDKEWFTMTVMANGKHLAVWVNGYQTADFTDSRPPDKSARNGSKTDAGPVSLQGHDPTTDLSFRNIRIGALPREVQKKKEGP